jgi:hypothetical protein
LARRNVDHDHECVVPDMVPAAPAGTMYSWSAMIRPYSLIADLAINSTAVISA